MGRNRWVDKEYMSRPNLEVGVLGREGTVEGGSGGGKGVGGLGEALGRPQSPVSVRYDEERIFSPENERRRKMQTFSFSNRDT